MRIFTILVHFAALFRRFWLYILEPLRSEEPFKPKLRSHAPAVLPQVNQRRLRKQQRAACRSGDRFAFA